MKMINQLLIIDDSIPDCRFTQIIAQKSGRVGETITMTDPEEALSYLKTADRKQPDLILLDINMPKIDGFQFADAYHELYPELKLNTKLVIATNSLNPNDKKRAEEHPAISGFINKPSTVAQFEELTDIAAN